MTAALGHSRGEWRRSSVGGGNCMRVMDRRFLVLSMIGLTLLFPSTLSAQTVPRPTGQELAQAKNGSADWITYGGALNNQRYSALNQINTTNVQNLKGVWMSRLGSGNGAKYRFEADPLVID